MPVRCLACGTVYEGDGGAGMPGMCPQRYLSPHGEDFMRLVAEGLERREALEEPTRDQHMAAIKEARGAHQET